MGAFDMGEEERLRWLQASFAGCKVQQGQVFRLWVLGRGF